jgi:hypothetical protein
MSFSGENIYRVIAICQIIITKAGPCEFDDARYRDTNVMTAYGANLAKAIAQPTGIPDTGGPLFRTPIA